MKSVIQIGLLLAIVLSCSLRVFAQDDGIVHPDRPSFSTGAHIVPKGRAQFEAGAGVRAFGDTSGFDVGELLARVGLSSRIEIRAGLPTYTETMTNNFRTTGASDSMLGGKILLKSGERGAVSVLATAILPTGSRSVAEHAFQPGGSLISDVNASKKIVITTNVGYMSTSMNGDRHDLTFAVSTLNYSLTKNIALFSEFYVQNIRHTYIHRYAATGGSWTIRKRTAFDWDGGIGIGNHAHGPDYYYGIGISWLF